jgi:hypothetical protein
MSSKTLSWILLAATALGAVLLLNYWASYQLLSTLAYAGIVLALLGLANLVIPFRFLGIRKRAIGALLLVSGVALTIAALFWPAPMIRVAQPKTRLDDIMPDYQFSETHSIRIHAPSERVMQAVRESTFGDMKSLATLLKIRAGTLRTPSHEADAFSQDKRIIDAFSASGYATGGSDHEIVTCGGANVRAQRPLMLSSLQQFAEYREPGAVKMAFDFYVEDTSDGRSTLTAETRVLATDDLTRRGMGRYWRLIVPGSGLLRRQWLDGIKRRAESQPQWKHAG